MTDPARQTHHHTSSSPSLSRSLNANVATLGSISEPFTNIADDSTGSEEGVGESSLIRQRIIGSLNQGKKRQADRAGTRDDQDESGKERDGTMREKKRATQACLQCRKRKLRCLGGWPCKRCIESKGACDFGRPGLGRGGQGEEEGTASAAYARLQLLEDSVVSLLAGLASGPEYNGGDRADIARADTAREILRMLSNNGRQDNQSFASHFDPNNQSTPSSVPLSVLNQSQQDIESHWAPLPMSLSSEPRSHGLVRFDLNSFQSNVSQDNLSDRPRWTLTPSPANISASIGPPSVDNTSTSGIDSLIDGKGKDKDKGEKRKGKGQKAEERLAVATEGVFGPPFKALAYQPSLWDNREASRRNSPDRTQPVSRDEPSSIGVYDRRYGKQKDDPINTGIVDMATAETLFEFYMEHCHQFMPVVDVTLSDAFNNIRKSPALISAIIAIGARFYNRYCSRTRTSSMVTPLDPSIPFKLVNLAEFHLAQTLLRKQHTLSDVQAILLLAAWCLVGEGGGPDAWLVTGHAVRVARRLGVHRALAQATESAKVAKPGTPEWTALEQFMPQWRTWLAWLGFDSLFSLGFGRPQSTHCENLDESSFLNIHLCQPLPRPGSLKSVSLYGDIYIAAQVQLTHIGRDVRSWGELLAGPHRPPLGNLDDSEDNQEVMSAIRMFEELNLRLDEWSRLWVWSGSPYAMYLGSSVRISRLQAEHMRLCLNSYALKYSPDEGEFIAQCLKKAFNAAVTTIQTHFDSTQSDFSLSFATDYLTITVAQAALFLIHMTKSPPSVKNVVSLDPGVIKHYLDMSIELLEMGDLSETNLSTFLARTIRDISRVAGISGMGGLDETAGGRETSSTMAPGGNRAHSSRDPDGNVAIFEEVEQRGALFTGVGNPTDNFIGSDFPSNGDSAAYGFGLGESFFTGQGLSNVFDIDGYLQLEAHSHLGSLLDLPGDLSTIPLSYQVDLMRPQSDEDLQQAEGVIAQDSRSRQLGYRHMVEPTSATEFGYVMGGIGEQGRVQGGETLPDINLWVSHGERDSSREH